MDKIEARIINIIEEHAQDLIALGKDLYLHPEQGYHEFRTSQIVQDFLSKLKLELKTGLARTGVTAEIGNGKGPNVALIGELDGVSCPAHPFASDSGISHSCGHNAQIMAMLGAAMALSDEDVSNSLDGTATIYALPAEEFLDVITRNRLREESDIVCAGGKCELIRRGEFDKIDMAITTHTLMTERDSDIDLQLGNNACNGFIGKTVHMHGTAAHAAAAPDKGVNALNAASLGMAAVGMIRETFREADYVRVHPYIKHGGDAINTVPHHVIVDMMVRANNQKAIELTSDKVDKCFQGAAMSIGCEAEIIDSQGYMPCPESLPQQVMWDAAALLGDDIKVAPITAGTCNTASTDVGDLFAVMPVLNFCFGGSTGALHSKDYEVTDDYKAYVMPAKMMALLTYKLLKENACEAKEIIDGYDAPYTIASYCDYVNSMK